jgi:hypothetical protein
MFNPDDARDAMPGQYLGCCVKSAGLMVETTEQSIAAPQALAYCID